MRSSAQATPEMGSLGAGVDQKAENVDAHGVQRLRLRKSKSMQLSTKKGAHAVDAKDMTAQTRMGRNRPELPWIAIARTRQAKLSSPSFATSQSTHIHPGELEGKARSPLHLENRQPKRAKVHMKAGLGFRV